MKYEMYEIGYFYPTSPYAERFCINGGYVVEWGKEAKGFASYCETLAFAKTIPNGCPSFFSLDHPDNPSRMASGFGVKLN